MKKKILILGGSFSYIGCVLAVKKMGHMAYVADRDKNAVAFKYADVVLHVDISDADACVTVAKQHGIDAIVPVNDFGVMTSAVVAKELNLAGVSIDVAEIASDKYLMRKVWEEHNVPSVRYRKVSNLKELYQAAEELKFPLIIKPCDSRGGGCRGIRHIDNYDELDVAFDFANSFYKDGNLLVEEFVTGLEHSVEVIVSDGESHIIAISDKVKSPLPYRVDDTILYPTIQTGDKLKVLKDAVASAVAAVGIVNGIAHVELSMTDTGPVLFELGARCGGGAPDPLVPFLTGINEFQEAVRIALGETPKHLTPVYPEKACVIKFFYPEPGIVTEITGVDEIDDIEGVLSFSVFVKEGDVVRSLKVCGDRAGMVIAGADNREKALKIAQNVINTVKIKTKKHDK